MGSNNGQGPSNARMRSLRELFESGSYSDLTIVCGEDHHKVHKAIVCPRSSFFASACNGGFREAETGVIHLPDDDPLAVKMMLHYFYLLDYSPAALSTSERDESSASHTFTFQCTDESSKIGFETTGGTFRNQASEVGNTQLSKKERKRLKRLQSSPEEPPPASTVPNLTLHAKIYALGEKYGIYDLKELAVKKFRTEADIHWRSDEFLRAMKEVYTSTIEQDRVLRDIVIDVMSKHMELLDRSSMQDVIKDLRACFDLLMHLRRCQTTFGARSFENFWT